MQEALRKLSIELDWQLGPTFKEGRVLRVWRNKSKSEINIKIEIPKIPPLKEYEDFFNAYNKNFWRISQVKNHFSTLIAKDQSWTNRQLETYIKFILENKMISSNHHLLQLFMAAKIVKISSTKVDICFYSEYKIRKFKPLAEKLIATLVTFGFPQIEIEFKMAKDSFDPLELERQSMAQEDANFLKQKANQHVTKIPRKRGSKIETTSVKGAKFANEEQVVIEAEIIKVDDLIVTRNDGKIQQILVADDSDAIFCKFFFFGRKKFNLDYAILKVGNLVRFRGKLREDKYSQEKTLDVLKYELVDFNSYGNRKDFETFKRIELACHTKMSSLDSVVTPKQLIDQARFFGHKVIGFTDTDNVQAYPDIYNYSKKLDDIKVLYGATIKVQPRDLKFVDNLKKNKNAKLGEAKYVIFDLETTGLSAKECDIIEFGAVKMQNGNVISTKQFFVNIHKPIPTFIQKLTNITNKEVESGLEFEDAIHEMIDFFEDAILVAHNASFDISFVKAAYQKLGAPKLKNSVIDSLQLSRFLLQQKSYTLMRVCKKYGVNYDASIAHRADYDAQVLAEAFWKMVNDLYENKEIITILQLKNAWKRDDAQVIYGKQRPYSATVFAKNQAGLKTLFKLISLSHTDNFQKFPFVFDEALFGKSEDLLIGSSEGESAVFQASLSGELLQLENEIKKYDFIEVQPPDHFLHLNKREILTRDQVCANIKRIIKVAKKLGKIVVATTHARYLKPSDKKFHEILISTKGLGGARHPLFRHGESNPQYPNMFYRTTEELKKEFLFLKDQKLIDEIVVDNPMKIADQIKPLKILKTKLYTPKIEGVTEKLYSLVLKKAHEKYGKKLHEKIAARIKKEWHAISTYKYEVIYWLSYKLVQNSLANGYLVGSRGSVGSSIIATFLEITEVNPLSPHYYCSPCSFVEFIKQDGIVCGYDLDDKKCPRCQKIMKKDGHSIPFETFLGFKGDKVPDIDLNFSGDFQARIHQEVRNLVGKKYAFRAGTISTVASRTAYGFVKAYEETNDLSYSRAYIDYLVQGIQGTKRTTGQHPGGIIVVPKTLEIEDFSPINFPANDPNMNWETTHFDFHAIHDNLLKLDLLGHDDPTVIKMLEDLTNVRAFDIPNSDKKVIELFNSPKPLGIKPNQIRGELTGALGIPEFGTDFVRRMLSQVKINHFADLVAISGLSHGTDVWTNNAQSLLKHQKLSLSDIISCRDDIMIYLISMGVSDSDSFRIMEKVRKGKGLSDSEEKLLKKHKVPDWYIDSCKKIKYIFPKAHATAYVKMAWRIAWNKINYPLAFYASFFSTRVDSFDISVMIEGEDKINQKLDELIHRRNSKKPALKLNTQQIALITTLLLAQEMYARGFKIKNLDLRRSDSHKWTIDYESKALIPPFITVDGLGDNAAKSVIEARNQSWFKSDIDLLERTSLTKKTFEKLDVLKVLEDLPRVEKTKKQIENNRISLFDL